MRRFLAASLATLLAGCVAAPRQMYEGAPLPPDRVAVIQMPPFVPQTLFSTMPANWLEVRAFDGKVLRSEERRPSEFHVTPGRHRLVLRAMYANSAGGVLEAFVDAVVVENRMRQFEQELELDAAAGRTYGVRYTIERPGLLSPVSDWKIDYWIEDMASGKVLDGTRMADQPPLRCTSAVDPLPLTLADAADRIALSLDAKNREMLLKTKREDLAMFHLGWGMGIRNSHCLWHGNRALIRSACSGRLCDPESASMKIMEAVWDRVHQKQN
jgi:hypothetical protein